VAAFAFLTLPLFEGIRQRLRLAAAFIFIVVRLSVLISAGMLIVVIIL
jgi:hypothetical protein